MIDEEVRQLPRIKSLHTIIAAVAAAVAISSWSGMATAQPPVTVSSVEKIADLQTFGENLAKESPNTLLVTTGEGLFRVFTDKSAAPVKLYTADSLGGIGVYGGKAYFAVGNDFAASVGGELNGSIRSITLGADRVDDMPVVQGIPAPNGLAILPNGTITYSTILGKYAGIHEVGADPSQLYAAVPSPNGLTLSTDGVLYVGSTLTMQVYKVDPQTRAVLTTGVFAPLCDDLTVTKHGILTASIAGIWFPEVIPALFTTPELLGATSVKQADDAVFYITTMSGGVFRIRLSF